MSTALSPNVEAWLGTSLRLMSIEQLDELFDLVVAERDLRSGRSVLRWGILRKEARSRISQETRDLFLGKPFKIDI